MSDKWEIFKLIILLIETVNNNTALIVLDWRKILCHGNFLVLLTYATNAQFDLSTSAISSYDFIPFDGEDIYRAHSLHSSISNLSGGEVCHGRRPAC